MTTLLEAAKQIVIALKKMGYPLSVEAWRNTGDDAPTNNQATAEVRALHRAAIALAAAIRCASDSASEGDVYSELAQAAGNERGRQKLEEGFTSEHDAKYINGELVHAAASYLRAALYPEGALEISPPPRWPFGVGDWKPTTARRNLEKSLALLLAEDNRLWKANLNETVVVPVTPTPAMIARMVEVWNDIAEDGKVSDTEVMACVWDAAVTAAQERPAV